MPTSTLTADYARDGFVIVRNLLSVAECDKLKAEAFKVLSELGKPGATVCLFAAHVNPAFRALSEDPRVVAILRGIMPGGVMFLNDKIVFKAADQAFATPWHIDCFYWRGTRPKLSVWIPLDDVSAENGALTVVAGSHLRDWNLTHGGVKGEFWNQISDDEMKGMPVTVCEVPRGSAVIFSDRLVHGSTTNTARRDRYVIIGTYQAPAADEPFDLDFPARKVLVPAGS
jgi:ectoine hydroxylase-related dioxygenase (phytanoyl-CoA dioxygenase family)